MNTTMVLRSLKMSPNLTAFPEESKIVKSAAALTAFSSGIPSIFVCVVVENEPGLDAMIVVATLWRPGPFLAERHHGLDRKQAEHMNTADTSNI